MTKRWFAFALVALAGSCTAHSPELPNGSGENADGADLAMNTSGPGATPGDRALDAGVVPSDLSPPLDMTGAPFSEATHPAFPQVTSQGGAVYAPISVVMVMTPSDANATQLGAFGTAMPASNWWSKIKGEYGLTTMSFAQVTGPALASYLQTCPSGCTSNCSSCMTGTHMLSYIEAATSGQTYDPGHTVFLLEIPSTVTGIFDSTLGFNPSQANFDCSIFTGYHSYFSHTVASQNVTEGWGFVQNCFGLDDTTTVTSHEIFEGATDTNLAYALNGANQNTPWNDSIWSEYEGGGLVELADLCEGTEWSEGGFAYQRVWSNAAAAAGGDPCAPALATPYNSVSAPKGWYSVAAGATVTIPLTGFATGVMNDWVIDVPGPLYGSFTASITSSTHATVAGTSYATINNSQAATLSVKAPSTASSGEWITLTVESYPLDWAGPTTTPAITEDAYHYWPIGIYIP